MKKIYIDGGTRYNQICLVDGDKVIVKTRCCKLTNNELEYLALIYALEYCNNVHSKENITIYSDSMLVVKQVTGKWRITTDRLERLHTKVMKKMTDKIKIVWISRDFNLAGHVLERKI